MSKVGIMAYGTQLDRDKLAVLASVENKSSSQWVLDMIRTNYTQVFGQVQPDLGAFKK